jgi:hypothetical protein
VQFSKETLSNKQIYVAKVAALLDENEYEILKPI